MPSMQALRERTMSTIDSRFAELVRITFMVKGQPDPERPSIEILAVLRTSQVENRNLAGTLAEQWHARVALEGARLHIDRTGYSGPVPAKGDRVRAISRPGSPGFEVLRDPDDRGHRRLVLELGEI